MLAFPTHFASTSAIHTAITTLHTEAMVTQAAAHPDAYETEDAHVRTQALLGLSDVSQPYSLGEAVTSFLRAACSSLPDDRVSEELRAFVRIDNGSVNESLFHAAYDFLLKLTLNFDQELHREEIGIWRSFISGVSTVAPAFGSSERTVTEVGNIVGRTERLVAREGGSIHEAVFGIDHLEHLRRLSHVKEGRFFTRVRLLNPTYHDLPECLWIAGMRNVTHLQITNALDDAKIIGHKARIVAEAAPHLQSLRFLDIEKCGFSEDQKDFIQNAFRVSNL